MSPSTSARNLAKPIASKTMNGLTKVRSIQDVNEPRLLPAYLDGDIIARHAKLVNTTPQSINTNRSIGATSHPYVILAACRRRQKAHEIWHEDGTCSGRWRGAFTVALLASLRDPAAREDRSYYDLVHDLGRRMRSLTSNIDEQKPECRGADSFHRLFTHYVVELANPHKQAKAAAGGRHPTPRSHSGHERLGVMGEPAA